MPGKSWILAQFWHRDCSVLYDLASWGEPSQMGQHGQETACTSIPGEKWQIVQEKMVLQINFRIVHLRTHDDPSLGKVKPVLV